MCYIKFSPTTDNSYIKLVEGHHIHFGKNKVFENNTEWKDVKYGLFVKEKPHTSKRLQGNFDILILKILMSRNPTFYVMYLLIPSVLMAFVSVLVFLLPPESGERVGLSITVLLSYTVFLLMVSEISPRGGENTSVLGTANILVIDDKFMTNIIQHMHHNGE